MEFVNTEHEHNVTALEFLKKNKLKMIELIILELLLESLNLFGKVECVYKDVRKSLGIKRNTFTNVVNRLVNKGLIVKNFKSMNDYRLKITESGIKALPSIPMNFRSMKPGIDTTMLIVLFSMSVLEFESKDLIIPRSELEKKTGKISSTTTYAIDRCEEKGLLKEHRPIENELTESTDEEHSEKNGSLDLRKRYYKKYYPGSEDQVIPKR